MRLSGYRHGRIEVGGAEQRHDLIVLPDRVIRDWWRDRGHYVKATDLEAVLAAPPQVLVVGTGSMGMMTVDPDLAAALSARGIALEALPTAAAVERFNELEAGEMAVAAALHLTC